MKLVEILGKELNEWPPKADWAVCVLGTRGEVKASFGRGGKPKPDPTDRKFHTWSVCEPETNAADWLGVHRVLSEKASDQLTAIVTRADWEAERAKLKAPKADGDGWVRNRGRSDKSPVDAGVTCTIKFRDGSEATGGVRTLRWLHNGGPADVMRYKIHKPAEQPAPVREKAIQVGIDAADAGKLTPIAEVKARILARKTAEQPVPVEKKYGFISEAQEHALTQPADTMLAIRDRIRELDTQRAEVEATYQCQVSEITKERESLVQKLAGEGLALVEVVVQPAEDMSDWRNWKYGDVLLCEGSQSSHYTSGHLYTFICISPSGSARTVTDNRGVENGLAPQFFKWHSRPAS
jgi:hypothetical protein